MSFRDELNSIRPDMKMISEQEMYKIILYETYEEIKSWIREDAKQKVYKNKLTGKVPLVSCEKSMTTKEYNRIREKESSLYKIYIGSEGNVTVLLKNETTECVVKRCLFSNYANVSVSLTPIGKKYVNDLMELAKGDDISFNFKPRIGEYKWIPLSKFGVTEKINLEDIMYVAKGDKPRLDRIRGNIDIYYEIEL